MSRPTRLAAAAFALLQTAVAGSDIVYIGSAGCDGDDHGCKDQKEAQKVLRAVTIDSKGGLTAVPALDVTQDGMPAWLTTSKNNDCLFVIRPDKDDVLAYQVGTDSKLAQPGLTSWSGGHNPVHASVSLDGRFLVVANYDGPDTASKNAGASVASLSIGEGCSLKVVDYKNHTGRSVNPTRQGAAHVHSVYALSNGLIYSCDLGLDMIFTYKLDEEGKLTELHRTQTLAGVGPRHIVQHPHLPVFYVVCEMGEVVLTYRMEEGGALALLQTSTVLPQGFSGEGSKAAELAILPDGSALYVTNRGKKNIITTFAVCPQKGTFTWSTQVEAPDYPRGMTLAEGGAVLLVAGQSKTELWSYTVGAGGRLTRTSSSLTEADGLPPNPATFAVLPGPKASQV
eukprot:CAMPEP_0177312398 /NCGR_PEP_ID=MMETSP0368-20130122/10864_1 /TAXON_ID=447022 ORGANISM="Scrippsiella hangoei-like, Strain SHHI-4" /NCGR_SAMPLE_ID=MMETSP0368 /ASSEMBLY_ACC=CAM_ASM_000363 /LENGTH=396 /DNA_ID=CAMNT_0018771447 /DNA_START=15 /DNA_END=1205 /DNA_ORIENTATION=+